MANENNRASTSTQIRNFYSDGLSYLNISFFNTNLSFRFYKFLSKDQMGKSTYDLKNGVNTTVNFEGASALKLVAQDIIDGKIQECNLPIPCAAGASLNLERKLSQNGTMETIFSITKNNVTIPFVFKTVTIQAKTNGQLSPRTIEAGLEAFKCTIEGYLNGVNAERHLNKLTEDYAKSQEGNKPNYNNNQGYNSSYNKNYNNNGYNKNYKKNYNNGGNWAPPKQQDMSSYQING